STDLVITQILVEEKTQRDPAAVAYAAKFGKPGAQKFSKPKDSEKKKKKCDYCKKSGHVKEECRKMKADNEAKAAEKPKELVAKIVTIDEPEPQALSFSLFMAEALATRQDVRTKWIVDSGASATMCSHRDWFMYYSPLSSPIKVWLGDERFINAIGKGRVSLNVPTGNGSTHNVVLVDVYYVPDLNGNLLSVSQFTNRGGHVNFVGSGCELSDARATVKVQARNRQGLYILDATVDTSKSALIAHLSPSSSDPPTPLVANFAGVDKVSKATLDTWHRRLGHVNFKSVLKMVRKGLVDGMEITGDKVSKHTCKPCFEGKHARTPIRTISEVDNPRLLHRIYADIVGPMQTVTRQGYRFSNNHVEAKSHYNMVRLQKTKEETADETRYVIERAEMETGQKLNFLRTDGGGEYDSTRFRQYLKSKGIHHEKTTAYTPQHNGVEERFNRTIFEMARTMLNDAGLPNSYWGDAVLYASYILNRTPTRALPNGITPYEAYTGNRPYLGHIRIFGCKA
ncbi:hypothetical protein EUX98_g9791, partial [Antrodiella citrinella]